MRRAICTRPGQNVTEVRLPNDTDAVLAVYVDGVPQSLGRDFDVETGLVRFHRPVRLVDGVTALGNVLTAFCAGVYPRGHEVSVLVSRAGRPDVITA
jgi:hypothetical protein